MLVSLASKGGNKSMVT